MEEVKEVLKEYSNALIEISKMDNEYSKIDYLYVRSMQYGLCNYCSMTYPSNYLRVKSFLRIINMDKFLCRTPSMAYKISASIELTLEKRIEYIENILNEYNGRIS